MKLTLTLNEVETGTAVIEGSKDRRQEVLYFCRHKQPIPIHPVTLRDGRKISAIFPTGEVMESNYPVISFRPIWCKLFTVNSMKKDTLTRLVAEFEFGKYMIDVNGIHQATLTTSGNGTDPAVVRNSEIYLGKFLDEPSTSDLAFQLISFIQRSF